ncbi:MAG: type II secretion system F family protein [Alphaproteobacteria bacterium]|nr:MAG: type II secretion system F family protein [Alphaproteobacteria bacterium]
MDAVFELLSGFGGDGSTMMVSAFVFLSAAALAFGVMAVVQVRLAVKRRAAEIGTTGAAAADDPRSLRYASKIATQRLIDYTAKHYSGENAGEVKELRRRLIQAGFLDSRAPAFFFLARAACAVALALLAALVAPYILSAESGMFWPMVLVGGILGYFAPSLYLSRVISVRQVEHRTGFPDFMDLLVVCADAGLSMEAALDRVGRELADSYRSLSANIHMATLEMRAGRTLSETLDHLADRLGLEEARSFATLLQQSEKLGSSLTEALRVYSDDMRHKRMSRAEEKAYSLPAKLSVPLTLCVFPVVIIVILLPVYVRLKVGAY